MNHKRKWLEDHGIFVGERDPQRNRAFKGRYMVCEDRNVGPTDDASEGGFCIVGDTLNGLITQAYDHLNT